MTQTGNESPLRCRMCGASPEQRRDPVSPEALAYTCSACLMKGSGVPRTPGTGPARRGKPASRDRKAATPGVIREARSHSGRLVRFELECNNYPDAKPYYTVAFVGKDGHQGTPARHTPFLDRAEVYFDLFLRDVTDPEALQKALAEKLGPCPPSYGTPSPAADVASGRRETLAGGQSG